MKVLFVVGCLQAGRSGVGDYARLLAARCMKQGHECLLLSIRDHWVAVRQEEPLRVGDIDIRTIRLPEVALKQNGHEVLKAIFRLFEPEWVSVQFVPYAFHPRGVVWPTLKELAETVRNRSVHVMFHEIWIGDYYGAPFKERWLGRYQKWMIQKLVQRFDVKVAHTSNALYRDALGMAGITARVLPMFGTIELSQAMADSWLFPMLREHEIHVNSESREGFWFVGFFGSIHSGFSFDKWIAELCEAAKWRQQIPVLFSIGELGAGECMWKEAERATRNDVHLVRLGHQPEQRVSEFLNSLDHGISATPIDIIGKSSSALSMLEHGLTVLAVSEAASDGGYDRDIPAGVMMWRDFFEKRGYLSTFPRCRRAGVSETAECFIAALAERSNVVCIN